MRWRASRCQSTRTERPQRPDYRRPATSQYSVTKFDLQGYELEALRVAEATLESTTIVFMEIQFTPQYVGAPTFCDLNELLTTRGFDLFDLYSFGHGAKR